MDHQFWPVLVALTVLCGIGLGAVLTILRGPWLWGSLLLLPVLAVIAVVVLFYLDNTLLRRSLQFAILLSLSIHLLIMVFASVINIFQNPYVPQEKRIAQRRVRAIEISDRRASFVWDETNSRETPEPDVLPEKIERPTTTDKEPQPIPVEQEIVIEVTPQLVRREVAAKSIPRQNPELSLLQRQPKKTIKLKSSVKAVGKSKPAKTTPSKSKTKSKSKPTKPNTKLDSSPKADKLVKRQTPKPKTRLAQPQASLAPKTTPSREMARAPSATRRAQPSERKPSSASKPSPSLARIRSKTPDIPLAKSKTAAAKKIASAATPKRTALEPSKSADRLTKRPTKAQTTKPAATNKPSTKLSPKSQLARSVTRRAPNPVKPTISTETSPTMTPRRAVTDAKVAVTPDPIENPARAPQSNTASRQLSSKSVSVSRSTKGVTGIGRSENLDRYVGGTQSPAARASDSARRERTLNKPSDTRVLSSSQKSEVRRTVGANQLPTSAFKAETSGAAKVAGSNKPRNKTVESSAARIDARSGSTRDKISAEKGSAALDIGPLKIVTDRQSTRRSGGGQPEVSKLAPDSTRRSKDRSDVQPTLVASTAGDVAAPRNQSAMTPAAISFEASDRATFAARVGGQSAVTAERWSAEIDGEITDQGKSEIARQFSDTRPRAKHKVDDSSWDEDEDEDEDEENLRGTRRTRIAKSPVLNMAPGLGTARSDGRSATQPDNASDSPSESVATTVRRQSTTALPGSGLGQTAANALLSAATSLPIIESNPSRRTGRGKATQTSADISRELTGEANDQGPRSQQPSVAPTMSTVATNAPATSNNTAAEPSVTGSFEAIESVDAASVSLTRTDLESLDEVQGSQLEIDADEGPAGLSLQPDSYVGVLTRPASKESKQLQPDFDTRFKNQKFGGSPTINPDAVIAREAFRNRSPAAMANVAEPTTEAAIHLGLEFLARYQSPDGSWSLGGFDADEPQQVSQLRSDAAATGLALLAFQGAGYNHREFKYARQIDHAIQWLIEHQSADGGLYVPSNSKSDNACRLYSHGIATLALTEAYGMTQDSRLKEAAQSALDYIAQSRDDRKGGWRYFDTPGKKSTDTSVSGWMMMALQSGRLAGLDVDENCFAGLDEWLDVAADPDNPSQYRYNPYAVDSKGVSRIQGRKPTPVMTSVGLLMRVYGGWKKDDPRLIAGAQYMLDTQMPSDATPQQRDTYYWYHATQVMKHAGGAQWTAWDEQLRPLLTRSQESSGDLAGSWHPYKPVPDRWGAFGGRIYVTSMNLLSLEVRHRMLPIYRGKPPTVQGEAMPLTEEVSTAAPATKTPDPEENPDKRVTRKSPLTPEAVIQDPAALPDRKRLNRELATADSPGTANPADTKPKLLKMAKPSESEAAGDSQSGSFSGVVTLDGQPLDGANLEFVPADAGNNKAAKPIKVRTDKDGRFLISVATPEGETGIQAGKYKVKITTVDEASDEDLIDLIETIPAKFNTQTKLTVEILGGKKTVSSFDLKSE